MFVSRVLVPMLNVLENVKSKINTGEKFDLKLLLVTFHDTNLSNLLRFLKYFDTYGFEKFVRFSSSLRFELLKDKNSKESDGEGSYAVRIVFDNEELKLPFCAKSICEYSEFKTYLENNLIIDYGKIDEYCDGGMGDAYVNELKFK